MDAGLVAAPTSAKPPTKHSKQSTDGKHFEEQGRKGSKQQLKLLGKKPQKRGKKKKKRTYYERGHHTGNAPGRLDRCRKRQEKV